MTGRCRLSELLNKLENQETIGSVFDHLVLMVMRNMRVLSWLAVNIERLTAYSSLLFYSDRGNCVLVSMDLYRLGSNEESRTRGRPAGHGRIHQSVTIAMHHAFSTVLVPDDKAVKFSRSRT